MDVFGVQLSSPPGNPCRSEPPHADDPRFSRGFLVPKLHRVAEFFASQGITMAGNLFYGFLCLRLLPVADYAQYAVIFGFLATLTILMDVGVSNTLAPLVGERIGDRQLIADYVASVRQLAHWIYLAAAPIAILLFPFLVHKQHWPARSVAAMVAILLVAGWFARVGANYGTVLILVRDRKRWYREQMRSSLGTLALLLAFWSLHWLNVFSAVLINVAGIVYVSQAYFFRSHRLLQVRGRATAEKRREIIHLASPNSTSSIFYALQGQISVLLIAWFGRTAAVAGIGALSRLSQLFVLPLQMNPLLIEPYFARLPRARLKANYVTALVIAASIGLCFILLARFFPQIFLWILGPHYSHLRYEILLMMIAASIRYTGGVMWTMNSARKFVYWGSNLASIGLTLLIEIYFIWRVDLSTIRGVLSLSIATAVLGVAVHSGSALCGFLRGPRQLRGQGPRLPSTDSVPATAQETAHAG